MSFSQAKLRGQQNRTVIITEFTLVQHPDLGPHCGATINPNLEWQMRILTLFLDFYGENLSYCSI